MRILLVEDDRPLAQAVLGYLQAKQFSVDWAENLQQARALVAVTHYSAVLLDLNLPDGEGLQLLPALASTAAAQESRPTVIVVTARDQVSDRIRGLQAGAVGQGVGAAVVEAAHRPAEQRRAVKRIISGGQGQLVPVAGAVEERGHAGADVAAAVGGGVIAARAVAAQRAELADAAEGEVGVGAHLAAPEDPAALPHERRAEPARVPRHGRRVVEQPAPVGRRAATTDPRDRSPYDALGYVGFTFDNEARWNRGDRTAVLELELIVAGEPRTWAVPAKHTMLTFPIGGDR